MSRRLNKKPKILLLSILLLGLGCLSTSPEKKERDLLEKEMSEIKTSVAADKRQNTGAAQSPIQKSESIENTIRQYEAYVTMPGPLSETKLKAMRRLADLYIDLENQRFALAMEAYEQAIEKGSSQAPPPTKNFSKSISLYEKILKTSPKFSERDQIFYHLASSYDQMGEREKSMVWLRRLATEFSTSEYLQEVYFRLGEYYFDRNDLNQSLIFYEKGSVIKTSPLYYVNTLYKRGWTLYLLENFPAAVDSFREILDYNLKNTSKFTESVLSRPDPKDGQPSQQDLVGDTLQMLSRSFTEMNQADSVSDYFKRIGQRPYVPEVYFGMASYIAQQDRFPESLKIFDLFLTLYPLHERVLDVYEAMVKIYVETKNFEKASAIRRQLVSALAPNQDWYAANTNPEVRKRAFTFRLASLEELALYHHHLAQTSKQNNVTESQKNFEAALVWYQRFIKEAESTTHVEPKKIENTRYLLSECFFECEQFFQAGENYLLVSQRHPETGKKIKAGQDAFIAFEKEFFSKQKRKESISEVLPKLRTAREHYEKILNDHKIDRSSKEHRMLAAFLEQEGGAFFKEGDIAQSRPPLERLVALFPESEESYRGLKLLALGYFKQQQYEKAESLFSQMVSRIPQQKNISPQEIKELKELRAGALFKIAEGFQKRGEIEKSASAYLKVSNVEPGSSFVDNALYQAGTQFLRAKKSKEALTVLRRLAREFPKSDLAFRGLWESALAFKVEKKWVLAGDAYVEAFHVAKKETDRKAAQIEAGLAFEEGQQFEGSIPIWQGLLQSANNPSGSDRVEYAYRLGNAHEKVGQIAQAKKWYTEAKRSIEKMKQPKEIQTISFYAGKTFLALGYFDEQEFLKIKLVQPFEKNLKLKQKYLDSTLRHYTKVVEFRDAEMVTEVGFRIGFILEEFAKSLKESPAPSNLNQAEKQQYAYLLEEKAFPFEEKAIAAHEGNLKRGQENGLFNDWVKKSHARLALLLPAKYGKNEKMPEIPALSEVF